jgi:hypothetical protein
MKRNTLILLVISGILALPLQAVASLVTYTNKTSFTTATGA